MQLRKVSLLAASVCILLSFLVTSCGDRPANSPASNSTSTSGLIGEPGKTQSVDVFSGNPLNWNLYTDYNGDRLYFCCSDSRLKFLSDPSFYYDRIKRQGILLNKTPAGG